MPFLFPLVAVINLAAVGLTLRFHAVLMAAPLDATARKRLEGIPADGIAMINSGGPALRFLKILFTREYVRFGSPEVAAAGDRALAAQVFAGALMVGALATGAM